MSSNFTNNKLQNYKLVFKLLMNRLEALSHQKHKKRKAKIKIKIKTSKQPKQTNRYKKI